MEIVAKGRFKNKRAFDAYCGWIKENAEDILVILSKVEYDSHSRDNIISGFLRMYQNGYASGYKLEADKFVADLAQVEAYTSAHGAWYNVSPAYRGLRFFAYGNFPPFPVPAEKTVPFPVSELGARSASAAEPSSSAVLDCTAAFNAIEIQAIRDNRQIPLADLKKVAALSASGDNLLATPDETLTVASLEGRQKALEDDIVRVEKYDVPGLKEVKAELDRLRAELDQRTSALREQMNAMKAEMEKKLNALKMQIRLLSDQIFMIECYLGDSYELFQIRTGRPAPEDKPVIILQKLRYLDEDLAQLYSLYGEDVDGGGYRVIEDLFKHNDTAVELFTPYDRCIVFFRISKDSRTLYSAGKNMLESQELLHGGKIGFLLRNGDNLYVGYVDDDGRDKDAKVVIKDDVFYRPAVIEGAEGGDVPEDTPYVEKVSRAFCFYILEGILKRREILSIPEPFTLMNNGGHVVFSYADRNIEEKKYGDFRTLLRNVNRLHTEGDTILVMMRLCETYQKRGSNARGLRNGDVNRTHDCNVEDGLNRINLVDENDMVYVSAQKEWSDCGARSNFRLEWDEYLNLTYFNSVWIRYFLSTKALGNMRLGGETINFAYAARYLKMALDYILKREEKERELILAVYPGLDAIRDWQVILSHWKIVNRVRQITAFQAKRFGKALASGKMPMLKHLYEEIPNFHKEHLSRRRQCYINYAGIGANGLGEKADRKEIAEMLAEDTRTLNESAAALRAETKAAGLDYDALVALAEGFEGKALPGSGFYDSRICHRLRAKMDRYLDRNLSPVPLEPGEEIVTFLFSNHNRDAWRDFQKNRERSEALLPIAYANAQIKLYGQLYDIMRQYEEERYFMGAGDLVLG